MFPSRYFPDRYFAPRYWPKVGATAASAGQVYTVRGGLMITQVSPDVFVIARRHTPTLVIVQTVPLDLEIG